MGVGAVMVMTQSRQTNTDSLCAGPVFLNKNSASISGASAVLCGLAERLLFEVNLIRCAVVKALVWTFEIVQQGLRTPTKLNFENFSIDGIRGSVCPSESPRRLINQTVSFFAAR